MYKKKKYIKLYLLWIHQVYKLVIAIEEVLGM